jgi:membrane-bound lytic murein transglycosylase B
VYFHLKIQWLSGLKRVRFGALGGLAAVCLCGATPGHALENATAAATAAAQSSPQAQAAPLSPDAKFFAFIRDFRATALASGITPQTYDSATANIKRNARVIELNGNQPEFVKQVWSYLDVAVSDKRVTDGLNAMNANLTALNAAEKKYGVPKEILVSIWGNESDFGAAMGSFNMFEALATLAAEGPRTDYARPQFLAALQMMQQEHFRPEQMTCSWAGAFGHTQLIPSEFLAHAVDGDGDGRRDMWGSPADSLASSANILVSYGWIPHQPAYVEVRLPPGFAYELADIDTVRTIAQWKQLGLRKINGGDLRSYPDHAALLLPAGARGPAFLVYDNFRVILKYNNAASYALAIAYLANRIAGGSPFVATWPRDERAMTHDERIQFQINLRTLGYDPGKIDGVLGRGTKAQLRLYQKARSLPPDGFPTIFLLNKMAAEVQPRKN